MKTEENQRGWTDDRVEKLKKLWASGLSATQCAKEIGGVTRCAVIGKVHRLGLKGRTTEAANAASAINLRASRRNTTIRPSHAEKTKFVINGGNTVIEQAPGFKPGRPERADAWKPLKGSHPRPFIDRPYSGCRWPVTVAGENLACCEKRMDARYCAPHARLSGSADMPRAWTNKELERFARSKFAA